VKNKKISKTDAMKKIDEFFLDIHRKTPVEIRKVKRLAANKKIPLKNYKKLFCSKCLTTYDGEEKIRIKHGLKTIECKHCGKIKRIKLS